MVYSKTVLRKSEIKLIFLSQHRFLARPSFVILEDSDRALSTKREEISTEDGKIYEYAALLLAIEADPVKLPLKNPNPSQVFYSRSPADGKAIVLRATSAKPSQLGQTLGPSG